MRPGLRALGPEEDEPRIPPFTLHLHYEKEPDFEARILFDPADGDEQPTLLLKSDFHAGLYMNATEEQLRRIALAINERFGHDRRTAAALAATKDFSMDALEEIVAGGKTLEFALRESVASGKKEN